MHVRVFLATALAFALAPPVFTFQQRLRQELTSSYKKWVTEDVGYILTDEERLAWRRLATDDEREQFVEDFWIRRDPTPDTIENEFKEEHYRRIAYANERFASGLPGWKFPPNGFGKDRSNSF